MDFDKNIKLRPKFEQFSPKTIDEIKASYEVLKTVEAEDFKFKDAGNHIWLGVGLFRREYWSPSLHIELDTYEDGRTFVKGIFGPDPVLWFVFLGMHFIVGGLFILFGVIAYSKWSFSQSNEFDLVVMFALLNAWLLLYFMARLNRKKGATQMRELLSLANKIID